MSAHTPAPWQAVSDGDEVVDATVSAGLGLAAALIRGGGA